jgi:hypothetical protein
MLERLAFLETLRYDAGEQWSSTSCDNTTGVESPHSC